MSNVYMPGAVNLPSPNHSPRPAGARARALVLHVEGGTDTATQAWFQNPAAQVSAHFSVARDGTIHQYVSTADAAWANGIVDNIDHGPAAGFLASIGGGNPNDYSVSIEHEGQSGEDMTAAQFAASVTVAVWLFGPEGALAGISCDRTTVLRHSEIGSHPQCPGFPEDTFTRYIAAVTAALEGDDVQTTPITGSEEITVLLAEISAATQNNALKIGAVVGQPKTYLITLP